jgi:translation elongation factor EF-Tu-like GTPase
MSKLDKYFKLKVSLYLYSSDRGRRGSIVSGYRPRIYFSDTEPVNIHFSSDCVITLRDIDALNPGETTVADVHIIEYQHLSQVLSRKVHFFIKEGTRSVGEGEIISSFGVNNSL